ncbi:unnamed protein product [Ectocarpus sp. 4 AP-2014]
MDKASTGRITRGHAQATPPTASGTSTRTSERAREREKDHWKQQPLPGKGKDRGAGYSAWWTKRTTLGGGYFYRCPHCLLCASCLVGTQNMLVGDQLSCVSLSFASLSPSPPYPLRGRPKDVLRL